MSKPLHESRFTKEELSELKASECTKLKKNEDALTIVVAMGMFSTFVTFIMLVALLLWFSKVTIFLSIVVGVPNLIIYWLYVKGYRYYKKLIDDIKVRIHSQQKQAL